MKNTLITKDSKGKIRVVFLALNALETDDGLIYLIQRSSGQKGGKMTIAPDLKITSGKVKRTLKEQAELQYNSELKKYLDKGYKKIEDFGVSCIDDLDDTKFLAQDVTNQNGIKKPMLAKSYKDLPNLDWNRKWLCSSKLDGLRTFLFIKDGKIQTSSRGGENYNVAATYIIEDPTTIAFFQKHPDVILDGELYIHGKPLNYISGLGRLETLNDKHRELKLYVYDIVDESKTFAERLNIINKLKEETLNKIIFIPHYELQGESEIMEKHNAFVGMGYEGLVMRDPNETYKCGGRDKRMVKVKIFQDAEYQIVSLIEGLRDEDMCFLMKTKEGYEFKAKPIGTREEKQYYREHINEMIGKMATIKYFGMTNTEHPVPNLPVWKCLRDKKDI